MLHPNATVGYAVIANFTELNMKYPTDEHGP
jgi:hypothetical protein